MGFCRGNWRTMLCGLAMAIAVLLGPAVQATPPAETCFVVSADAKVPDPTSLRCTGVPQGYSEGTLWLRVPIAPAQARNASLAVQVTRFEQLDVYFEHQNGVEIPQTVTEGAFADKWHVGGQLAFAAPGDVPTQAVWLRLEGLESYDLLKLRIVSGAAAQRQFELTSLAIGAALALLGIAALFNFGLAIGLRRRFFLWHGGWSAAVMLWGVVWSQIGLLVLPGIAGTITSRLATGLACFAILLAALATASALRGILEKAALRLLVGLGSAMFAMGVASGLPGADITFFAPLLGIGTLMSVAVAVICIATAWRKGHVEGRDLAISWALPMATLVLTLVVDLGGVLWGGGDKIVMLFASALQVVCLTAFATTRLGALRVERDTAIATGKRLAELAERDPLTGLLNRRGFLARCAKDFGGRTTMPFGLILIDVDRFKAVNDEFGHQTGDEALILLADKLKTFEAAHDCHAGRLGGEEFVLGVSGIAGADLRRLGEAVRTELAKCPFDAIAPDLKITVSIGIAQGLADGPFGPLYRLADDALYAAKRAGRNRVVTVEDVSDHGAGSTFTHGAGPPHSVR